MTSLSEGAKVRIEKLLRRIYGDSLDDNYLDAIFQLVEDNLKNIQCELEKWNNSDIILITYGNSIRKQDERPLQTLHRFLQEYVKDDINIVHILPFFPYSSDDGFSVINYYEVDSELGSWDDISRINEKFDIMTDLVINHISRKSEWFQNFLVDKHPGKDYFIKMDPETDISSVTRPRSGSLFTLFKTAKGEKYVWTTFSSDQIDLDFRNPWVLYEMLRVLFFYLQKGVRIIRLDAIAYLWKKPGTSCIHLPETHRIVNLIRELAELINPEVIILTETNVPHKENLSYFGENYDEAHMIYQFSLPSLLLYTLHAGCSKYLSRWIDTVPETNGKGTYVNFTASHDGIGVRALEGILPEKEKKDLLQKMVEFGGYISTKMNPDGSESPYELNIAYFDALKGTKKGLDSLQEQRFICSQTIMMTLKGIPAFYIHSLTATRNDIEGVERTGRYRSINRGKLDYEELIFSLTAKKNSKSRIFYELKRLIRIRKKQPAFHPDSEQYVIHCGDVFLGIKRIASEENIIWSISNITDEKQRFSLDTVIKKGDIIDLIENRSYQSGSVIMLKPYQTLWLKK
ncbi:MAG: sugar phosphorylase [Bacteroidales bacterium]